MSRLDYDTLKKYAENMPNAEHTHLRELEELSQASDCIVCDYGKRPEKASILMSVKRDENDRLKCYYSSDKDGHALIIGSSGSGKSQGFGMNLLMNTDGKQSYLVTDPKGEYYKATYAYLCRTYGADNVRTLNFMQPELTDLHVNYLCVLARKWVEVCKSKDAAYKKTALDEIVNAIGKYVEVLFQVRDNYQPSWERIARHFIVGLILAMFEDLTLTEAEEKRTKRRRTTPEMINFYNINKIYKSFSYSGTRSFEDHGYLTERKKSSLAYQYTNAVIDNAGTTRANYFGFVDEYLKQVTDTKITAISAYNDFDIESIGKTPQVVFVIYDISDTVVREFVNKVIAMDLNLLLEYTHKTVKPLDVTVKLFLDEFATLKSCDVYPNILATGRGSNIFLYIVVQSYTQLEARYPDEYRAMIENCNFTYFIGTNDFETAKRFADELGRVTVPNHVEFLRGNFSTETVPVISLDYLMHRMKDGEMFVKIHRRQPVHGFFEFYFRTKEYKQYPQTEKKSFVSKPVVNMVYKLPWLEPTVKDDVDCGLSSEEIITDRSQSGSHDLYENAVRAAMKAGGFVTRSYFEESLQIPVSRTYEIIRRMLRDGYLEMNPGNFGADGYRYEVTITEEQFRERFCPDDKADAETEIIAEAIADDNDEIDENVAEEQIDANYDEDADVDLDAEVLKLGRLYADSDDLSSLYTEGFDMQEETSKICREKRIEKTLKFEALFPVEVMEKEGEKLWGSVDKFEDVCMDLITGIASMDKQWDRMDAVREAAKELIAVRHQSPKVVAVHRRVLYEFRTSTDEEYDLLRKSIFENT